MTRSSSPARSSPRYGEYVSDRLVRFPGSSWQEIQALPQPLRWTVQRTIFHLLDEPAPALADPFPRDDPLLATLMRNSQALVRRPGAGGGRDRGRDRRRAAGDRLGGRARPGRRRRSRRGDRARV
jgi:hypothetical protein